MRNLRYLAAAALVGVVVGCDALDVTNPRHPDRPRILATPTEVEALASAQFQQVISGTMGNIARVQTGMMTASFMNASTLANNGMGPRGAIPRGAISNVPGNTYQAENFAEYRILASVARNTADILVRAKDPEFTLGPGREGDRLRLIAWSHFISGVAHGYLSLVYDQAAIAQETDSPVDIPDLVGYQELNQFALTQFDSTLVYLDRAGVTALPGGWLTGPGGGSVSVDNFRRLARTFRAKMRADVARYPSEREAVNWQAVVDDATNGIQEDLVVRLNPAENWDYQWLASTLHYRDVNWHQMTPYIIGMADGSGGFDAWLATPRDQRRGFVIVTPDRRFPQGATRSAQNRPGDADDLPLPDGQYFRNRDPGKDDAAASWRNSQYDHYRFRALSDAGRTGPLPFFTRAENDMLAAEGYIRLNQVGAAAELIDRTRTANGLPALSGAVSSVADPVPGGSQCVPRIPVAPNFTSSACGNILEAMKWERRMETAYTSFGAWFFDGRGWGDLPRGTAVHWPMPWQEADARALQHYNLGGQNDPDAHGPSTYGYGEGDR